MTAVGAPAAAGRVSPSASVTKWTGVPGPGLGGLRFRELPLASSPAPEAAGVAGCVKELESPGHLSKDMASLPSKKRSDSLRQAADRVVTEAPRPRSTQCSLGVALPPRII